MLSCVALDSSCRGLMSESLSKDAMSFAKSSIAYKQADLKCNSL